MAYTKTNIIARRGYSGVSGLGGITDFFSSLFGSYNTAVAAQGAANQAQLDTQRAVAAQGGIGITDVLLLGGVGFAAYMLLFRKKKAA